MMGIRPQGRQLGSIALHDSLVMDTKLKLPVIA